MISLSWSLAAAAVVVAASVVGSAMAPEQYIAISTARDFIGIAGKGCGAFFEACERLDFFKVPPSRWSGPCLFCCADVERRSVRAVSETGCRPDIAAIDLKMQEGYKLKIITFGRP